MSKKDNKFKQDNLTLNNSPEKKHCSTSIKDHKDMLIEYNYDNASDFYVNEPGNAYLRIDPSELDDMKSNGLHVIDGGNQAGKKTLKDYLALPEGARTELIDGEFYDMASPTSVHTSIASLIWHELFNHIMKNNGSCRPFHAPIDVQLDCNDQTMIQPDVFVICDKDKKVFPWVIGAPDFIVEVVSPSNRKMDVIIKKLKYEKAGVREYWIVFPEEKRVTAYLFEKNEVHHYTFSDMIPVGIWDGRCTIDFSEIYTWIQPLYDVL